MELPFGQVARTKTREACEGTGLEVVVEKAIDLPNKEARALLGATLADYDGEGARRLDWPGDSDFLPEALRAIRDLRDRL